MTIVLQSNYPKVFADSGHDGIDPVWREHGEQAPPGKIDIRQEGGLTFMRHECQPGVNWNGTQRADVMTDDLPMAEGQEVAWRQLHFVETGYTAPNAGWNIPLCDVHDVRGTVGQSLAILDANAFTIDPKKVVVDPQGWMREDAGREFLHPLLLDAKAVGTQANMEPLYDGANLSIRVFGGEISTSSGSPVNSADRWTSGKIPYAQGVWHDIAWYYLCSSDRTKGRVKLVIDGVTVVDKVCATIYTGSHAYLKGQAFYRDPNQSGNKTNAVRFQSFVAASGPGCFEEIMGEGPPPPTSYTYVSSITDGAILTEGDTVDWLVHTDDPAATHVEFYADNALLASVATDQGQAVLSWSPPRESLGGGFHVLAGEEALLYRSPTIHWTVEPDHGPAHPLSLHEVKRTASKVTVGWTPPPNCVGYEFFKDGKRVSNSWNEAMHETSFGLPCTTVAVRALGALAEDTLQL